MLPLSKFIVNTGYNCTAVYNKMVSVDPTSVVMAFVRFFMHPGEPAGCSHLMHAPAQYPGQLRKLTTFNGKAYAFCDDVGSGTAPLVEFPKNVFESTGLLWAHAKWDEFDLGFNSDHAEFSVVPMPSRQTYWLPNMIWVPPHYVSLLIGCCLMPC